MDVVYETANLIDAHRVRLALEPAGIPTLVRGEALLRGVGELPACGLLAVCVPGSCGPEAKALVEALPPVTGVVQAPVQRSWPHGVPPP